MGIKVDVDLGVFVIYIAIIQLQLTCLISVLCYNNSMSEANNEEDKRVHLQMIQGVISRMGGNLFYLRGWSIAIIAGVLALLSQNNSSDDHMLTPLLILAIIALMFWIYDGYFLAQERRYRGLYGDVRKKTGRIDFSMDTSKYAKMIDNKIIWCMFSKTIFPFYVLLLAATVYLIIIE